MLEDIFLQGKRKICLGTIAKAITKQPSNKKRLSSVRSKTENVER